MTSRRNPIAKTVLLAGLCTVSAAALGQEVPVPEPTDLAVKYYWTGNGWYAFSLFWGILIPALIAFSGFGAVMGKWAAKVMPWKMFQPSVYWLIFIPISAAIDLPLAFYRGYVRQHAYEMSTQTLGDWFQDTFIGLGVTMLLGTLVIWLPYLAMRVLPRTWWVLTAVCLFPFILFMVFIQPVYIDPLTNNYQPMQDKALEAKVLTIAETAGIEGSRVFEVDKSTETKALNAYVTGFGDTKRVVMWDTILKALDEDQLLVVVAHEAAHYVLNHVIYTVVFLTAVMFFGLGALHFAAKKVIGRYEQRLGYDSISAAASMPLLLALMSVIQIALVPIVLGYSRHNEFEADRFALELTQDNVAGAEAFARLQEQNLGYPDPGPVFMFFRGSHPSLGNRIRFFNSYKPWETGEPLVYEEYFDRSVGAGETEASGD